MILSEDEVDDLKKQCHFLTQRVEQARANLTIQSKYRDAAASMSRLYSPSRAGGNRASGGSDAAREAEDERDATQKKCEELAAELWSLEQRLMEPQRRLLEHTAGILQHAHKTAKKTGAASKPNLVNGVPASPESMYTTSNAGRDSLDFLDDGFVFDEASLYRSFDMSDVLSVQPRQNAIEIPLKSPVREQNKQLAEETEKLRQENEALLVELEDLRRQGSEQWNAISDTEQRLEKLNYQLRDVIVKADPVKNSKYDPAPSGRHEPGDMLDSHLEYLEHGLSMIGDGGGNSFEVVRKLQLLNSQVQDIVANVNPNHPSAPTRSLDADKHLDYLQESLHAIDDGLQRAADMTQSHSADRQKSEQSEAVLMGLWDIIQSGYADIRVRKQERRQARTEKGLEPDEEDMSDGESGDLNEAYTLPAFSAKVQWLYTQATRLNEQKYVLKRQIKQQRELNSKSDTEKDRLLHGKDDELEAARVQLSQAEKETDKVRAQLSQTFEELETLQNSQSGEAAAIEEARQQLKQRSTEMASLEASTRDTNDRLAAAEASIQTITLQLTEAKDAQSRAEKAVEEKQNTILAKERELGEMTGMVAALKTEATLIKAELDGAYGSRKERAAEVAALHNTSESSKLQERVVSLEQELKSTADDLTDVVRQSLESEKKIGELESQLDRITLERDRIRDQQGKINEDFEQRLQDATGDLEERMEAEVAKLRKQKDQIQEELDKERLKAGAASPGGSSKTSYLTDSYRVGLRAERKKYEEQLRVRHWGLFFREQLANYYHRLSKCNGARSKTNFDN